MWTKSIKLPVSVEKTRDEDGFESSEYHFLTGIPVNFTSTTRNDELMALQLGYNADVNIELMACNYNGQSFLIDEETDEIYNIKRSYRKNKSEMVTLTCERRERGEL